MSVGAQSTLVGIAPSKRVSIGSLGNCSKKEGRRNASGNDDGRIGRDELEGTSGDRRRHVQGEQDLGLRYESWSRVC